MLNRIYVDSRYPPDIGRIPSGEPTKEEAQQLYNIAKDIFDKILKILEQE